MPQDLATGPDGKVRNARPIELENGEAKVHGIVTYPGGDRIDWRRLELPKDKAGTLSLKLTWKTPRPGLAVGIDVFDEYGRQVVSEKSRKASARRMRKADIANAKGTYLIRIFAPARGDAGAYTLTLAYAEAGGGVDPGFPPPGTLIPDPPHLPAVPTPPVPCDASNYKTNPACTAWCPVPVDPQWPGCANQCPQVPDVNIPACQKIMDCNPWDSRIRKCKSIPGPVCPAGQIATTCEPPPPPKPVRGTVDNIQQVGRKVEIRINRGANKKIERGWLGRLLDSKGNPIPQSDFVVTKVGDKSSWGQVELTSDQVVGKTVELRPPP